MATLVEEIRSQEESALSFKPGGSHIQIDSISIEISSGEINAAGKECKHFSIRGFVLEQRKKDIRLSSPFVSDGDLDNSNVTSLELPPLDVHKFKCWRCGGCQQDCNSSQGTSKDIAIKKNIVSQNSSLQETGSSKGLSKLFAKGGSNGFTNGSLTCQKSANSRGASFLKSISEAVVVPFKGLDFDKALPSKKSDKALGMSKVLMGPPSSLANGKSKEHNVPKSAASSHGTSNGFTMPPSWGFPKSRSGKSISSCKQQNVQIPKPNARIWQKGETSTAGTLHKKRNYAKRSVQQSDSAGDQLEIHKADVNSFANNSNREAMQHYVPKEIDARVSDRFIDGQAAPEFDLDKNEEVGSSNKFMEKLPNHSSPCRPTDRGQSSLPECSQFNSVHPLVESNRLLKRPRIDFEFEEGRNNMYEEEEEEDHRGLHLRRVPKIRLLSDVIAKYPTRAHEQPENISAKSSEQIKRPASPVSSHDISAERDVPDKPGQQLTKSVSGSWKKRRTLQDSEEHLADSSNSGAKRSTVLSAEPENRTEVEKKSKKTALPTPAHGAMDKSKKQIFYPDKEERVQGFGKKQYFPQTGEDYQPATKFLQFGPDTVENARGEGTSDYIIIGNGFKRRSAAVENHENAPTPSTTFRDYLRTSVSTENELWISRAKAGGTVVEHKGGEGSSCTQQKGIKGHVKDIDINSIPVDEKTSEPGAADDIPMDIVELLAKHQHERRCDTNREKHISVLEVNGEKTTQKPYPTMLKPQASYSRNGFGRQFEPVTGCAKQNLSGNLFNQSRNDDPFCAGFSGYTQSQGQVPGGAQYSSSIGSTAKCWNGNMPSFRPTSRAQSFNRYPTPPNAQIWPPLGMYAHPQGSPSASQGTISFNIGNPNPGFLSHKMMRRPVDLASNETIPAMQLLNLVQVAGSRPSTPPAHGNTEFFRKLPFQNPQYNPGLRFDPYTNPPPFSRPPLRPCSSASPTPQMFVPFPSPLARNLSSDYRRNAVHMHSLRTPVADIARKTEVCMINRNPAEISDLKEMRRFMIGPEELRRGKPRIAPNAATIPKGRGRPRLNKT